MARKLFVIALIFVVITGLASAQEQPNQPQAPTQAPLAGGAPAPADAKLSPSAGAPATALEGAPAGAPSDGPAPESTDSAPAPEAKMPDIAMPGPTGANPETPSEGSGASSLKVPALIAGVALAAFFN